MTIDLEPIEARLAASTGGRWHWAGNTDTGEPYLATWVPGAGRCQVLSIGSEERSAVGRAADKVRSDAREYDLGDPDALVEEWMHDPFGNTASDPRLWFMTGMMAAPARDLVVYEVAPEATSREDPAVYRADIVGIHHPDAEFIEHSRADVEALVAEVRELRAREIAPPLPTPRSRLAALCRLLESEGDMTPLATRQLLKLLPDDRA